MSRVTFPSQLGTDWEAGRRQVRLVPQAGEEHRSPGSRCSTGSPGKALLAQGGRFVGKGLAWGGVTPHHGMGMDPLPALYGPLNLASKLHRERREGSG